MILILSSSCKRTSSPPPQKLPEKGWFEKLLNEAKNGDPEAQYKVGEHFYFEEGKEDEAKGWWQRASDHPEALCQLGSIALKHNQYREAIDYFKDAIKKNACSDQKKDIAEAFWGLGKICDKLLFRGFGASEGAHSAFQNKWVHSNLQLREDYQKLCQYFFEVFLTLNSKSK